MENKKLIRNEYYSLLQLFSTSSRKIIIPDFQRDYCWGDKTHGEKNNTDIVSGFLDTLIEEFEINKLSDVLLGKIDVYEDPPNYIYLTDGQQRLTTLYLLIGMLFKKVKTDVLKKCLISNFEETQDDKEPYLQYAVRETTVFFLRDLVNEFFIKENALKVSDIRKQPWYFSEYALDPSIISMLAALKIIETELDKDAIGISAFSEFVIDKIKIQYYDVLDKKHGEERFVIINTTGKSLTVSENIKPILLGNIKKSKYAEEWEGRETFFWKNKKSGETIADNGVNDFLTWCFQIIDQQESFENIKKAKEILKKKENQNEDYLDKMQTHFESLRKLLEYLENDTFQTQFKFVNDANEVKGILGLRALSKEKQQNILLPLLAFISKFKEDKEGCYQFLRRLRKNYFDKVWVERNLNYVDWRYILQIIEDKESDSIDKILEFDTINFKQIGNVELSKSVWFNDEARQKHKLSYHNKLLEWEDYPDFMGDLTPLFDVTQNSIDIKVLQSFYEIYQEINLNNFTTDVKLKNIYNLIMYLQNGEFESRSVGGWGYCMLTQTSKHLFLQNDFVTIWKKIQMKGNNIFDFFNEKLKIIFRVSILKIKDEADFEKSLETITRDLRLLGHYDRVRLWAVLEYFFAVTELKFENSIAQFWEYPNLITIKSATDLSQNDYSIGNLLLGTSYYNNKTGWILFNKYPLMKKISDKRDNFITNDIKKKTNSILEKLKSLK